MASNPATDRPSGRLSDFDLQPPKPPVTPELEHANDERTQIRLHPRSVERRPAPSAYRSKRSEGPGSGTPSRTRVSRSSSCRTSQGDRPGR